MYYPIDAFSGLGDEEPVEASSMGSGTTWIAGGILVALAIAMFVVDTKDPLKLGS